eukprot:CAMPEP_0185768582 /NCGR_PEP_ID=MMETSP1174-20130828/50775_1 /TAXON_ID=35687 /ORGANISM="Dictyocha speculum, Strain CCMP1381" /LENGTH=62 /DNA_ID=CAMNT_0028453343 /DNA_START=93 /DNA_END=278 /DNA_ORIENTATION=+
MTAAERKLQQLEASLLRPKQLVGKWVDIDDMGPARVLGFRRILGLNMFVDSVHTVQAIGGFP